MVAPGGPRSKHQVHPLGMAQSLTKDTPQVRHRARRETRCRLRVQEGLHVSRGERGERSMTKARCQVETHDVAVRDVRPGPYRKAHHIGQPVLEEGAERQVVEGVRMAGGPWVERSVQSVAKRPSRARQEGGRSHSAPSGSDRARARQLRSSEPEGLRMHGGVLHQLNATHTQADMEGVTSPLVPVLV